MNMELIQSAASDALVNVVLAVIALAGAYAVYYIRLGAAKLKEQTAQIKDEAGRKVLEDALDDVVNLATVSVGAMEQTTAKALRDAVKSGKASREELLALGKQVFDEVKAAISPQAQKVITDNLGSFDKYLTAVIEDAVLKVKQEDPYLTLSGELIKDAAPEDKAGAAAQYGATIAMFVFQTVITAIIGVAAWGVKNAIGEMKAAVSELKAADKKNAEEIAAVRGELGDLKADLPLIYTTREDFIRVSNNIDQKLDKLLYRGAAKEG